MTKWKTVRVRQELMAAVKRTLETGQYRSLSEFVSEAIRLRLDELKQNHEEIAEKKVECPVIHERLLCSPNHIWVMVTPEGNIRVGLSDYAQTRLKGMVSIQTRQVGCEVNKEKPFGFIETWMFMFDLYAPISGKIVKLNENLKNEPNLVNDDPYNEGWIIEIKPKNSLTLEQELKDLLSSRQYNKWASKLEGRLRE